MSGLPDCSRHQLTIQTKMTGKATHFLLISSSSIDAAEGPLSVILFFPFTSSPCLALYTNSLWHLILKPSNSPTSSASARNSALPAMVVAEKYLELCCIWRAKVGKTEEVEGREVMGIKASRGPREGVVAVKEPDGLAVRNVPLQPPFSDFYIINAIGHGLTYLSASSPHLHFLIILR